MKVKFWPRNQSIPSEICNHRYNGVMTFSHQTDARYLTSIYAAELYGFKNNFKLGAFVNNITGPQNDGISDAEMTGLMRHDIYYPVEYWINPITSALQVIPDWAGTSWTSAGAAVFNVTSGASKTARYPNHGQQIYDVSGGNYGYDLVNGVTGGSNLSEYKGIINYVQNWLLSQTGRKVSSGSYRLGQTQMADLQSPYWLGVRNSVPSPSVNNVDGNTFYGNSINGGKLGNPSTAVFSRQYWNTYPSTSRWWDMWNNDGFTKSDATLYVQQQIANTLLNNGWYRDFCHWHAAYNNGTITSIDEFLSLSRAAFEGNYVHTCSNGEALEYMYLRELSHRALAYELNGAVNVVIDTWDQFKGTSNKGILNDVDLERISTPLTVRVDLSSSSLNGKNIKTSYGKPINILPNVFLIEIPFVSKKEGFLGVRISESDTATYATLNRPTATHSVTDNVITLNSNMPVKCVLFGGATGTIESNLLPVFRSEEFEVNPKINIESGQVYKVGIISETGQANLITI